MILRAERSTISRILNVKRNVKYERTSLYMPGHLTAEGAAQLATSDRLSGKGKG